MHRNTFCRRAALIGLSALAATAVSAVPAFARTVAPGCPASAVSQPFAAWLDTADYALAPDGDLEDGGTIWTLADGAAVVEGNEPFQIGAASDHRSLALPAGSSATTAPMCIGTEHRTIRFIARNDGVQSGSLRVDAVFRTPGGTVNSVRLGDVRGSETWSPTAELRTIVNRMAVAQHNAMSVSWRFTPRGEASWSIDDVYVDPFRRN
ncbi:MAG: hypothetical protein M3401_03170 [Actinomycetota bacterium]|nr:hypothetical protein [Actinomycetota bacterium]